jgi:hypothetical protein
MIKGNYGEPAAIRMHHFPVDFLVDLSTRPYVLPYQVVIQGFEPASFETAW